jgi:hypothetical protein
MDWFGESWGAVVNQICDQIAPPIGAICDRCDQPIRQGDRGFRLPHVSIGDGPPWSYFHLVCLLEAVGAPWRRAG